ncbi:hypothetical protein V6N13_023868 [Hibiscus sabdariffa]|uniref:Uncharacterized protein n=1 Tax=Hibiscus sabdariffa TaxID=183260 RepID=A0ABR2PN14_9ROSI
MLETRATGGSGRRSQDCLCHPHSPDPMDPLPLVGLSRPPFQNPSSSYGSGRANPPPTFVSLTLFLASPPLTHCSASPF